MEAPIRFCETERIAPDTYVVRQLAGEGVGPVSVFVNSMVITGEEPIVVECGTAITRDGWLDRTFELVDPADVRWVYLSHDDVDHVGNLLQVLELCPRATLISTGFMVERMMADYVLPLDRMRWINDGESFQAGDRRLTAVTPPVFDSPTTRGLFDDKTGVYWAADSFASAVTHEVTSIDELDPAFYAEAFVQTQALISPWHRWLDSSRYNTHVDRVAALGASVVAGGHMVTLRGAQIAHAIELTRMLPDVVPAPLPGQAELEALVAMLTGETVAA
jgi:flavorubredoxin